MAQKIISQADLGTPVMFQVVPHTEPYFLCMFCNLDLPLKFPGSCSQQWFPHNGARHRQPEVWGPKTDFSVPTLWFSVPNPCSRPDFRAKPLGSGQKPNFPPRAYFQGHQVLKMHSAAPRSLLEGSRKTYFSTFLMVSTKDFRFPQTL